MTTRARARVWPQVTDGLTSWSEPERAEDGEGAFATIVTLESHSMVLRMDIGGVRAVPTGDGAAVSPTVYDSVSSFLLNNSSGFVAHFNSSLAAALGRVAQEREEEEAEEAAEEAART